MWLKPLAEQAGAKAVTRDADGNIQVEQAPIFGEAGVAYARAVKIGALAEADGAAQRADIELRQQYRDNLQGYLAAAQAFKDKHVQQMTDAARAGSGDRVRADDRSDDDADLQGIAERKGKPRSPARQQFDRGGHQLSE